MQSSPKSSFGPDQERALRRICNNPDFLADLEDLSTWNSSQVERAKADKVHFDQAKTALSKVPILAGDLAALLEALSANHAAAGAFSDEETRFFQRTAGALRRLQVSAVAATQCISFSKSSLSKGNTRAALAGKVEQVLVEHGLVPAMTRGESWESCIKIVLESCGEDAPGDCLHYIRQHKSSVKTA